MVPGRGVEGCQLLSPGQHLSLAPGSKAQGRLAERLLQTRHRRQGADARSWRIEGAPGRTGLGRRASGSGHLSTSRLRKLSSRGFPWRNERGRTVRCTHQRQTRPSHPAFVVLGIAPPPCLRRLSVSTRPNTCQAVWGRERALAHVWTALAWLALPVARGAQDGREVLGDRSMRRP